jgi:hypothetical protein
MVIDGVSKMVQSVCGLVVDAGALFLHEPAADDDAKPE